MDLATIQDWTRMEQERHMAPYHLSAINAIAICLNGSETPHAAALMITKIYDSCVEQPLENSDSDRVQGFWVILCDAARIFGSAQSRLIDLVHEISTQPDVLATDGLLAKDTNGMIYWRDVPGLPYALSDDALYYHHPYDHSPDETDEFLEQAPYLLNGTKFAATLFERGFRIPGSNLATQADHFIEDGIESFHKDEHVVKAQAWKVLVPVSATWIMIAGRTIYKMCLDGQDMSQNLYNKRVWNMSRWEYWKERLRLFENSDDFDEECRGYATRALLKMLEVEGTAAN